MDITQAAAQLRPGTAWNFRNGKLEQSDDGSPRVSVPTHVELDSLITSDVYAENRRNEYPPIGDQLDALWKGGPEAAAMKSKIDAVKSKYPKP